MPKTLRGRLILLLAAFVALVLTSAGATLWGLQLQRRFAQVINLAGRQRMLAQQMARLAWQAGAGQTSANAALEEAQRTFDLTLRALLDGGPAPYLDGTNVTLPGTRNPAIRSAIEGMDLAWQDFRSVLDAARRAAPGASAHTAAIRVVQQQSGSLVDQADLVVRLFEADVASKANWLRGVQVGFLVCAVALLFAGLALARASILRPLRDLTRAADRLGEAGLETAIEVNGLAEIRALSAAFEAMRLGLLASQQELLESNDSLEARVLRRTRELETLHEVSREIASRLDVQQVLKSVTEKARVLLDAQVAFLCLADENQEWVTLQAISGPAEAVGGGATRADQGVAKEVLARDRALRFGHGTCGPACGLLAEGYRLSHLAAPLRVADRVIGALCVGSPARGRFLGESEGLLTKLANTAAIALDNARLYEQAARMATLEERQRVAAEIHDRLGQSLSYMSLMIHDAADLLSAGRGAAALERVQKAGAAIATATADVRQAISSLMNDIPAALTLPEQLRRAVLGFGQEHHLQASWRAETPGPPDCPPQRVEQILTIAREALNNAARHAQATRVDVSLHRANGSYILSVEDDGRGFDSSQASSQGHFGLKIMRARAVHLGGELEIDSAAGRGTRVILRLPAGETD